jgi:lipopolysaccharide transport system ATP-binding protein
MIKHEIRSKFDEIVAFAEIEKFIDTPVKRYSSGMYVRLAFAVAAHLHPDVLIVDEVLAVGDLAFQAKCLAHLSKMKTSGTTVMIVSHNMQVISDSCARVIMLSRGSVLKSGTPEDVIPLYREALLSVPASEVKANELIEMQDVLLNGRSMGPAAFLHPLDPAKFLIKVKALRPIHDVYVNLHINLPNHQQLIHLRSDVAGSHFDMETGLHEINVEMPQLPLSAGTYGLFFRLVSVDEKSPLLWDTDLVTLNVEGFNPLGGMVSTQHTISHQRITKS